MIYLARTAVLAGDVAIEDGASVWHGAVLRGDLDSIVVGRDSNVQDNAVVHVDRGLPAKIGKRVTVGHAAVVHGCTVEDECLIGMNATINSGAVVRRGSVIGSGAVLLESADFPPESLIVGVPAKVMHSVEAPLRRRIELSWSIYRELAKKSLPAQAPILGQPSKQLAFERSDEFTRLIREK
jgi:carbonic anhydrase/acetyltransferase-like protein (isoleucine patch superfamily)